MNRLFSLSVVVAVAILQSCLLDARGVLEPVTDGDGDEDEDADDCPGAEESCNGVDDDCDGRVDEGDLCPTPRNAISATCEGGRCVPTCNEWYEVCRENEPTLRCDDIHVPNRCGDCTTVCQEGWLCGRDGDAGYECRPE
jgi:hypothetical protein